MTPGARLPERATEVVASVVQHRALSTEQVRAIHFDRNRPRWAQRVLRRLEGAGYLTHVDLRRSPRRLWYATSEGLGLVRDAGVLTDEHRLFTGEEVAGRFWRHTHAVNDAAIAFVGAARERGDEFGALSWRHEVGHPVGPAGAPWRRRVVADALLTYLRSEGDEVFLEQRFLELDRATRSIEGTARGLGEYSRLAEGRGRSDWRRRYPAFPPVLCVLEGSGRAALLRRRTAILALLRTDGALDRAEEVRISVCLAEDLAAEGPFAPIFGELREPGAEVDWLGRPA